MTAVKVISQSLMSPWAVWPCLHFLLSISAHLRADGTLLLELLGEGRAGAGSVGSQVKAADPPWERSHHQDKAGWQCHCVSTSWAPFSHKVPHAQARAWNHVEATRSGSISTAQAAPFWPNGKPRPPFLKPLRLWLIKVLWCTLKSAPSSTFQGLYVLGVTLVSSLPSFPLVNTGSPHEAVADQTGGHCLWVLKNCQWGWGGCSVWMSQALLCCRQLWQTCLWGTGEDKGEVRETLSQPFST